jgi:membrane associated rhomboid family serine protease
MARLEEWDFLNRPMPRSAYRGPRMISVTTWLIVANVAIYILDHLLVRLGWAYVMVVQTRQGNIELNFPPLTYWGHFSEWTALGMLQPWRFVTFQFLHANVDHLIFNMIALYFFGPLVEAYLTPRLFLPFYLLCGIGGAMMYLLLLLMGWRIGAPWVPLVGASAGIFGILIAAARIAPESVAYVFGVLPMRLRTLAYLFIAYAIFTVLFRGTNAGGEAAHLGGAAVGYLLIEWTPALERLAWFGSRSPPF